MQWYTVYLYLETALRVSGGTSTHHQERIQLYLQHLVFVGRGRAGRPDHDQQHCYHHTPTVKPEAVTAVVEFLMVGVKTPETC
jgi:hypothetical protein